MFFQGNTDNFLLFKHIYLYPFLNLDSPVVCAHLEVRKLDLTNSTCRFILTKCQEIIAANETKTTSSSVDSLDWSFYIGAFFNIIGFIGRHNSWYSWY